MLVFISDIHFTHGETCSTIPPAAFRKFVEILGEMAEPDSVDTIEVVLLGDIFDVIRSWPVTAVRPWWPEDRRGEMDKKLKDVTLETVNRICTHHENAESVGYLTNFKRAMAEKHKSVTYTYIVGNHDWLVNRYPETRVQIAEMLAMEEPQRFRQKRFEIEGTWTDYGVYACHGDKYDSFNYDGNRDASSLGDAIVIDLINKFTHKVEEKFGPADESVLTRQLREIDNVRPLIDIPAWIQGVCERSRRDDPADDVKKIWDELVDEFLADDFVRQHDRWFRFDNVDKLQLVLKISSLMPIKKLARIPFKKFLAGNEDYTDYAYCEDQIQNDQATYVVYGHTHHHEIRPLDQQVKDGNVLDKIYFNTGTWRRVHVQTAFDVRNFEFVGWYVMTFITFYRSGEKKGDRRFEVWNGAMG